MKQLLTIIASLVVLASCKTEQARFQAFKPATHQAIALVTSPQSSAAITVAEPVVPTETPVLVASNEASPNNLTPSHVQHLEKAEKMLKKASTQGIQTTKKTNALQKVLIKKAMNKVKATTAQSPRGFDSLDPMLKIGIALLAVALLLAIFGLGLIGGIAGLIALVFILLGLMNSY
jgi:PBP1b-binding outer membrane lipoprotein LpoB